MTNFSPSERQAEALLSEYFGPGEPWPVDRASLAALIDIGLSNMQIAAYFSVSADEVLILCDHYKLRQ